MITAPGDSDEISSFLRAGASSLMNLGLFGLSGLRAMSESGYGSEEAT